MQPAPAATPPGQVSESEMIRRITSGDREAFTWMMRRYNQKLYRTARSILRDDAEAEDSVQEAYLTAYRSLNGFRGDAALSSWLVRIVVNQLLGRLRKRKRDAEVIRLGHDNDERDVLETTMDEALFEQPERAALRSETRRLLEAKIDLLPEAFERVFWPPGGRGDVRGGNRGRALLSPSRRCARASSGREGCCANRWPARSTSPSRTHFRFAGDSLRPHCRRGAGPARRLTGIGSLTLRLRQPPGPVRGRTSQSTNRRIDMSFLLLGNAPDVLLARRAFIGKSGILLSGAAVALLAGRDALATTRRPIRRV